MFGQPSVKEIVSALKKIEDAVGGAKTRAPRSNFVKVIELLENSGASSVQELVHNLEAAQSKPKQKTPPKPANQEIVSTYIERLQSARNAPQLFEQVVDDLFKDKKVRLVQELKQIANSYTGGSGSYKSKKAAREAIERKYHGRWISDQYALKAS